MSDLDSAPPMPSEAFEQVLVNMELRALKMRSPEERARVYNLAGDMCFDAGLRERTLSYYGRAIDVYVGAEQFDAAVAVCRKIVRLTPEVVRARCTLAWMALGRGLIQEARERIGDYARAAAAGGQVDRARQHLRLMSEVSENQEVLETLAEALLELGDSDGADRAFGAAMGHSPIGSELPGDPEQRWSAVLRLLASRDIALVPVELVVEPDAAPIEGEAGVPPGLPEDFSLSAVAALIEGVPIREIDPVAEIAAAADPAEMLESLATLEFDPTVEVVAEPRSVEPLDWLATSEIEPVAEDARAPASLESFVTLDIEPVVQDAGAPKSAIADLSPLARRRRRVRQTGF